MDDWLLDAHKSGNLIDTGSVVHPVTSDPDPGLDADFEIPDLGPSFKINVIFFLIPDPTCI